MTDITVSSATQLSAALTSAHAGDVIRLAGGDYGDFSINSKVFAGGVTITSQDALNPASFHTLSIRSSQGLVIDDVAVNFTPNATTTAASTAVKIDGSTDISFIRSTVLGGNAVNGVAADATALDATANVIGLPAGYGLYVTNSTNVRIAADEISHVDRGIVLNGSQGVRIAADSIHDLRHGGIFSGNSSDVTITGNHISDVNPWRWSQSAGDHAQFVALWTSTTQSADSVNITITDNLMDQGRGTAVMGLWLQGNAYTGLNSIGFDNVVITDNAILSGHLEGIALWGVNSGAIENNVLLQTSGDGKAGPGVLLRTAVHGVTVSDNMVAGGVQDSSGSTGDQANTLGANKAVQSLNPEASGFYSTPLIKLVQSVADLSGIFATANSGLSGEVAAQSLSTFLASEAIVLHTPGPGKLVTGIGASDRLVGTGGDDTLDGAGGSDTFVGGAGNDLYYVDNAGDTIEEQPGEGVDTIIAKGDFALPNNVENLVISSASTNGWKGTGNGLDNVITGNAGANLLDGAGGSDTLDGGAGNDTLLGGAGDDSLQGGAGADTLSGGDGNDTLDSGAGASTIDGGAGNDSILAGDGQTYLRGGDGDDVIVGGKAFNDINGNAGADTIFGGAANDWLVGGKGDDVIHAGTGDQILYGNLGNDTLYGGVGNDTLRGGQGDDYIAGGSGKDWISGDLGRNTLVGGGGADTFHTAGTAGVDRVLDFNALEGDRVQLDPGTNYTLSQVGADTVISMTGGAQMTLVGVDLSTLKAGWIFGA